MTGCGTIRIKFDFDGKQFIHQLRDTLYVPNAPNYLLSLSQIDDGGGSVDFKDGTCWIKDKGKKVIGKGYKHIGYSCYMLGQLYLEQKGLTMRLPRNSLGINGIINMDISLFLHYNYWIRKIW